MAILTEGGLSPETSGMSPSSIRLVLEIALAASSKPFLDRIVAESLAEQRTRLTPEALSLTMEERLRRIVIPADFFPKVPSNKQSKAQSASKGKRKPAS